MDDIKATWAVGNLQPLMHSRCYETLLWGHDHGEGRVFARQHMHSSRQLSTIYDSNRTPQSVTWTGHWEMHFLWIGNKVAAWLAALHRHFVEMIWAWSRVTFSTQCNMKADKLASQ